MKSMLTGAAALLWAGSAAADRPYDTVYHGSEGPYGAIRAGAMFTEVEEIPDVFEVDTGLAVLGSLGYAFDTGFRLEGEVGYRRVEAGPVFLEEDNIYSFMANALYEVPGVFLRPYVGGGVGLSVVDVEADDGIEIFEATDESFTYQLIGGLAVPVSDNVDLVADYRYTAIESIEIFGTEFDFDSHNVTGGVRFRF